MQRGRQRRSGTGAGRQVQRGQAGTGNRQLVGWAQGQTAWDGSGQAALISLPKRSRAAPLPRPPTHPRALPLMASAVPPTHLKPVPILLMVWYSSDSGS
jgi:hypothetical protein